MHRRSVQLILHLWQVHTMTSKADLLSTLFISLAGERKGSLDTTSWFYVLCLYILRLTIASADCGLFPGGISAASPLIVNLVGLCCMPRLC